MYRTVFWTVGEGEGGMIWENGIETCILSYVIIYDMIIYDIIYDNHILSSPVQVRCMIQGAQGWCTGMTQRDGMGREEGSGWGTHVHPWRIHVDVCKTNTIL